MQYEFTDDLLTHNELIDSEHRNLIAYVNKLFEYLSNWQNNIKRAKATLVYLTNYVDTHFEHENSLMLDYRYPEMTQHMAWHNNFRHEVRVSSESLSQELAQTGLTPQMVHNIVNLVERLIDHIKTLDAKLAQHIQSILYQ